MKVALKPGVELDILTQEELHATLTTVMSGFARGPLTDRATPALELDGSGNSFVGGTSPAPRPIFRVPAGMQFALHRLAIQPDGYTFGVPFTATDAYLEIQRGGAMIDGISLDPTDAGAERLPYVFRYGTGNAPVYDNNQTIDVLISAGPANTAVKFALQGTLQPLVLV